MRAFRLTAPTAILLASLGGTAAMAEGAPPIKAWTAAHGGAAAVVPADLAAARDVTVSMLKLGDMTRAGRTPNGAPIVKVASSDGQMSGARIPEKWLGKLFFKTKDGTYLCNAFLVADNIVLTPAHCVQDRETADYHADTVVAFLDEGGKVASSHSIRCAGVFAGWTDDDPENEPFIWDYSMLLLDKPAKRGNFGVWSGWDDVEIATVVDGSSRTEAKLAFPFDDLPIVSATATSGDGAGLQNGAWVANIGDEVGDDRNLLVSFSTFGFDDDPLTAYGPYMLYAEDLFQFVRNGCS